ncbi:MAG: hypothetical protein ACXQTU_04840, partial [Candidatus Nezhaarchaeales archaeon]
MVALVSRFIRDLDPDDLELAVRFIVGELFPPWEPEIGLGVMGIVDSVVRVFSSSRSEFFKVFKPTGDVGLAAMKIAEKLKGKPILMLDEKGLTIREVYEGFKSIAEA